MLVTSVFLELLGIMAVSTMRGDTSVLRLHIVLKGAWRARLPRTIQGGYRSSDEPDRDIYTRVYVFGFDRYVLSISPVAILGLIQ